jgi:hypothetical protein
MITLGFADACSHFTASAASYSARRGWTLPAWRPRLRCCGCRACPSSPRPGPSTSRPLPWTPTLSRCRPLSPCVDTAKSFFIEALLVGPSLKSVSLAFF